jgi:hypothetical protein
LPANHPIEQTRDRLREILADRLGIEAERIEPSAELEELIPASRRRAVWQELRDAGWQPPPLELPPRWQPLPYLFGLVVGLLALHQKSWYPVAAAIPIGIYVFAVARPWAVGLPVYLRTLDELAVCLTNFKDDGGHRWTREEISLKIRLLIAQRVNRPLAEVREECTWEEVGLS